MPSLRHLLLAFAAMLSAAVPAAWGAVEIADTHVTNVGTTTFTMVWTTSEVSTPALDVYSDANGTTAITGTLGFEYYPIAEGDPVLSNGTAVRAARRALELLATNRRVVVVRVFGLTPGTTYFVRPRTFGSDGADNGSGLLPLRSVSTAQSSSLVADGRLVRVRFPAFAAEGMVALVQGPTGSSTLSAIVGDSADADAAVFPLANLVDTASGAHALFSAPQTITVRVIGAGAPTGTFTQTINYGTVFNVAAFETIDTNLTSPAPFIGTQPVNQSVLVGATATFTVAVTGTPAPAVKWQRLPAGTSTWGDLSEGLPYTGVATTTLTVSGATLAMSGDQFRAVASNGVPPDATSTAATLTVLTATVAPSITTQPVAASAVAGGNATFTVAVAGTPTPTVKWQWLPNGGSTWNDLTEGAPYSGTATTTLTITGATLVMSGDQFRAIATNGVGTDATSAAATLTVNVAPVAPSITTQPAPATVVAGANATFTVAVAGTPTPTVKWQRLANGGSTWSDLTEGAPYSGTATTTLTITGTALAMSGDQFRATATNGVGTDATSAAATLTVNAAPVAPSITTQPVSAAVVAGTNATFTVVVAGTPTPTVKWQRLANGGSAWSDLTEGAPYSGTATTTLTITGATLVMSGDQFRAIATNGVGTDATSSAATLTVSAVPSAPSITTQPQSATVTAGGTATFTVAASGTPSPSYRWQRMPVGSTAWDDVVNGSVYSGATTGTLTVTAATVSMTGDQFRAIAFNGTSPDAISNIVTLTVNAPPSGGGGGGGGGPVGVAPTIGTHPQSTTVLAGSTATFAVTVSGTPAPSVKWQRLAASGGTWTDLAEGAPYTGVSSPTLTVTGTTLAMSGDQFRVVASNGISPDATSNPATLTVNAVTVAPAILTQPVSVTVSAAANATFSVTVAGTPTPTVKWQRQPTGGTWSDLADGLVYSGTQSTVLTVNGATLAMSGDQFRAIASNGTTPDAVSAAATLTVDPAISPPVFTTQPSSQTVNEGSTASFSVQVAGALPITYQWSKDGVAIAAATSSTLTLSDVRLTDAGAYAVAATNSVGTSTSMVAVLTVRPVVVPPTGPVIQEQPRSAAFAPGTTVTLQVVAAGAPPLTYQWYKNGTAIADATSATLRFEHASIPTAGRYHVVVTNPAGSVTSRTAILSLRFAGTYFGNFGGNRGRFSLYVRPDGTGVFLGYERESRISLISRNVAFDADGGFKVVVQGSASAPAPSAVRFVPPRAAAGAEYEISGSIAPTGTLTGSVARLGLTFSAPPPAATGSASAVAGYYEAGAAGTSANSYMIVSPTGQAFVVTTVGQTADAGVGVVGANGQLSVTTENNARVTGIVQPETATISATVTPPSGAPLTFVGANTDVRTVIEKLVNVSTRTEAGVGSNTLIAGFVIAGTEPRPVLVRAVGPTLERFNVANPLRAVRLELFRDGTRVGVSGDWGAAANAAEIAAAASRVGAFELPANSRDAAVLLSLEPGAYSAVVTGEATETGVALVEVYDASAGNVPPARRIVNVSTRAAAGSGDATLIAGFVINGSIPKRVLIRGAGPSLAQFGVTGLLARPQLTIYSGRTVVATNSGWSSSAEASALATAATEVGAFAFLPGSQDAALILNLDPGAYTAQVTGADDSPGVALIEVYELP